MALGKGKPRAEDAPFFGELTVDLTLSEPEYRLPVDQEQISSMEALHEEIYFNTLHFFDVMGRFTRGAGLAYPGPRDSDRCIRRRTAKPGRAKISVTGFDAPRPSVVVEYVERGGRRGEARLDIPKIAVDRPQTLAATVRAGRDGIERLDLRVKVDTEKDERDALVKRTADERVDRTIDVRRAGERGVREPRTAPRGGSLPRRARLSRPWRAPRDHRAGSTRAKPGTEVVATLEPNGTPAPFPDIKKLLPAATRQRRADRPMGHADSAARGVRDPREDVRVQGGDRLQGRPELSRQRRLGDGPDAARRGLALVAGQADDDEADDRLLGAAARERSVVDQPCAEDGGAAAHRSGIPREAEEGQRRHPPDHQRRRRAARLRPAEDQPDLHAARRAISARSASTSTTAQWDADPIYPESGIRPKIWRTWLPDIFLNPHGYPSHEWVQLFSEYAAWVRTRVGRDARLLDDARLVDAGVRAGSTMRAIRGTRTSR